MKRYWFHGGTMFDDSTGEWVEYKEAADEIAGLRERVASLDAQLEQQHANAADAMERVAELERLLEEVACEEAHYTKAPSDCFGCRARAALEEK